MSGYVKELGDMRRVAAVLGGNHSFLTDSCETNYESLSWH